MNDSIQVLIERIRKEANDVKNCFTTFSFQAVAFSGLIFGAIANFQPREPFVGLAAIFIMVVALTVSIIGNYKYATANRHFGFELYLDNKNFVARHVAGQPIIQPQEIGWEQALRAWRVVQATVFDTIYYTQTNAGFWNFRDRWKFNQVKEDISKSAPVEGLWFEPRTLVGGDAK